MPRDDSSRRTFLDRLPALLTLVYLFVCAVSWQWHSGYWAFYGLSFVEHSSIASLLMGALNQPYLLQLLPMWGIMFLFMLAAIFIAVNTGEGFFFGIAFIFGAFVVLSPLPVARLYGNVAACVHSERVYIPSTSIYPPLVVRMNGVEYEMLPSTQDYMLLKPATPRNAWPRIIHRAEAEYSLTGKVLAEAHGGMFAGVTDPVLKRCRGAALSGAWREIMRSAGNVKE